MMDKKQPRDDELLRFRAEAAALLGVPELPADVFARPMSQAGSDDRLMNSIRPAAGG